MKSVRDLLIDIRDECGFVMERYEGLDLQAFLTDETLKRWMVS